MNGAAVPVRNAATIVLVRDRVTGPELLLLKRNSKTAFGPGAYVFPGGAIDAEDADPAWLQHCPGFPVDAAAERLNVSDAPWQYAVAALRECFEEAGLLPALQEDGQALSFKQVDMAARYADYRQQLNSGTLSFLTLCAQEGLRLPAKAAVYYSHWITPPGPPRRFSTRFFMLRAPEDQVSEHDGAETVDSCWIRPADALDAYRAGEFRMILPTVKQLEFLQPYGSAEEMLAAVTGIKRVPCIAPGQPRGS